MRLNGLRDAPAAWFLGAVLCSATGAPAAASAQETAREAEGAGDADAALQREDQRTAARRARERRLQGQQEEWWGHAREVLFADIEFTAGQQRGVDAILEEQLRRREKLREVDARLGAARREGDREQSEALRAEYRELRSKLSIYDRMDELREVLTEEQRPTFDRNRARLLAEGLSEREEMRRQREEQRQKRPQRIQVEFE